MKIGTIINFGILATFLLVLSACTPEVTCSSPYIKVGTSCCLDQNDNNICDKDEIKDTSQKIEAQAQPNTTNEKVVDKKELVEKTALRFARYWEKKDWENMYDLLIDDLQRLRTKEDFIKTLNHFESASSLVIRLDNVVIDNETTAFAYYTVNSALFDTKAPSMQLEWNGEDWKANSFATYFLFDELPLKECNDFNTCTSDVYFFKEHKCKNTPIRPCCGDKLCDGKEYYGKGIAGQGLDTSCPVDCFILKFDLGTESKIVSFLGHDFTFKLKDFKEENKKIPFGINDYVIKPVYIFNISVDYKNFTLGYGDQINLKDNIYLTYSLEWGKSGGITEKSFELFNKDK